MKRLPLILIPLVIISCSSKIKRISETTPPTHQRVLFGYSFVNHAWGYQNRGWFIDNHGLAKAYSVRNPKMWHEAAQTGPDSGFISEADLLSDYAQANRTIFEYSHFILSGKIKLIPKAAAGEITSLTHSSFDAGQQKYCAYQWDKAKGKYKEILLSISGDWTQTNLGPAADTLNTWLKDLGPIYEDSLKIWNP